MFIETLLLGFAVNTAIYTVLNEDYHNNVSNNLFTTLEKDFKITPFMFMTFFRGLIFKAGIICSILALIFIIRGVLF